MTYAEYDALPGIRASLLKKCALSMLHAKEYAENPPERTEDMRLGLLAHTFVLEPERVPDDVVIFEGSKRTKEWKQFQADNEGREIVSLQDHEWAVNVNRAVNHNARARELLINTTHEKVITWNDPAYGQAKARIDGLSDSVLIELKTTRHGPKRFIRTLESKYDELFYPVQLGWIWHGACVHYGVKNIPVRVIAVSKKPIQVVVIDIPQDKLKEWYARAKELACMWRIACKLESWPGEMDEEEVRYEDYCGDGVEADISTGTMEASEL